MGTTHTLLDCHDNLLSLQGLFSRLCMSEALSNSWISFGNSSNLSANDSIDGLLWHFYGDDQTAIIRNYPYFSHDPSSVLCRQRRLDPRFRPVSNFVMVTMLIDLSMYTVVCFYSNIFKGYLCIIAFKQF